MRFLRAHLFQSAQIGHKWRERQNGKMQPHFFYFLFLSKLPFCLLLTFPINKGVKVNNIFFSFHFFAFASQKLFFCLFPSPTCFQCFCLFPSPTCFQTYSKGMFGWRSGKVGKQKSGRIKNIQFSLVCVWLEGQKSGKVENSFIWLKRKIGEQKMQFI